MAKEQGMESCKEVYTLNGFWSGFFKEAGLVNPKDIKKLTRPIFTNLSHEAPAVLGKAERTGANIAKAAPSEAHTTITYPKWGKDPVVTPAAKPSRSPEEIKALAQQKAQQHSQAQIDNALKGGYSDPQIRRANKPKK